MQHIKIYEIPHDLCFGPCLLPLLLATLVEIGKEVGSYNCEDVLVRFYNSFGLHRGGGFIGTGVPGMYRFRYREWLQGIVTAIQQKTPAENFQIFRGRLMEFKAKSQN